GSECWGGGLALRKISRRWGGPPAPRLPHWGSFSDIEKGKTAENRKKFRRRLARQASKAGAAQTVAISTSAGKRSASAARNSAQPAPVNALKRTREIVPD